jgi:hypothetical protein
MSVKTCIIIVQIYSINLGYHCIEKCIESWHRRDEKAYTVLVRKPEGKRPLLRPRCRCEDNIRMDLGEIG